MFRGQADTYEIRELVARGRSGELFLAVDTAGRFIALKVHDRAADGHDEARRLMMIDHEAVVPLLDQGVNDRGQVWLALPWIDGRTLSDFLAGEAPVDLDRARQIIARLADGIDALHRAGVVHADLSPNNVMIEADDRVTLIDLGGSTSISHGEVDETTGLDVTVTARYAAPEVAQGLGAGPASDLYALALIGYELATGGFPLPSVATPIAMLAHHASTEPVAPSEHRPDLPAGVDHALMVGLAKDPADRHPSGQAFAEALHDDRVPRRIGLPFGPGVSLDRTSLPKVLVGVAVAGAAVFAGLTLARPMDEAAPWPEGRAGALSCNVLTTPGFEDDPLPDDFYNGDPTNTAALADGDGIGGSSALRVGGDGRFGLFGEIVPAIAGREYVLSIWVQRQGEVETSAIYVDYLDSDFRQLTAARDVVEVGQSIGTETGIRMVVQSLAPQDAAYAVPTVFKDGSSGLLFVDEAVFGLNDACPDLSP